MITDSPPATERSTIPFLLGLALFGMVLLGVQTIAISFGGYEVAARASLGFPALLLAEIEMGDLPYTAFMLCAGVAWLLLSTTVSAALALPVAAEIQPLQRMLLAGLLLTSVGWHSAVSYDYYEDSAAGLVSLALVFLVLLVAAVSVHRGPLTDRGAARAVLLTTALLAGIVITVMIQNPGGEEVQTLLVFLTSMTLVWAALLLRRRSRHLERLAMPTAFLVQAWLQTLWLPVPYFFLYID